MKKSPILLLVLCVSLSALNTPNAASAQDVSHCVDISNPDDRLNCFDAAFVTKEVKTPVKSDWKVSVETSKLDDTTSVYMSVQSDEPVTNQYNQSKSGMLMLRCKENTTSAFLTFGGHFMADIQGRGRVDYRIDDDEPGKIGMDVSTDNQALGLWNGGRSIGFIRRLKGGDKLLVRATPFNDSPVEMTFTISGLDNQIEPLSTACGWNF
jgi:type VI secretion system protein VasI